VPSKAPSGHLKPFYATAVTAWFFSQVAVFATFFFFDIPQPVLDTNAFDLMGLTFAIPVMVVSLVATAVMRGEMRALWRYTETWTPKPTKDVGEEVDEEGSTDEILAYSDAKEDEAVTAPAYVDVVPAPAYDVKAGAGSLL
jgi:hypothetical protein